MKRALCLLFFTFIGFQATSQPVTLRYDTTVRQAYAIGNLREALIRNGFPVKKSGTMIITLTIESSLGAKRLLFHPTPGISF